jgi:hypothetical protein
MDGLGDGQGQTQPRHGNALDLLNPLARAGSAGNLAVGSTREPLPNDVARMVGQPRGVECVAKGDRFSGLESQP